MSRRKLLLRLLLKAAWVRKDRALTALISVAVVATIATAALTIYSNLEGTLSREFSSFGANVVIAPANGAMTAQQEGIIASILGKNGESVPVAYIVASAPGNVRIVVGGADLQALQHLNSWWSLHETNSSGTALVGQRAATQLASADGKITLTFNDKKIEVSPKAVFQSGAEDDSRIYIGRQDFQQLSGIPAQTVLVHAQGNSQEIKETIVRLSSSLPGAEVQPVRRITQTQTAVVGKTRSVVLASSAVVVVLIMLCMVATFTSSVLERRKDFAVMKALGASNRAVNFLFAAEAALLALAGSLAGYIFGSGIAFWIGKANFDAAILPQLSLLLPVLLGSVVLALLASTAPLRLLQQIQPAGILRGE